MTVEQLPLTTPGPSSTSPVDGPGSSPSVVHAPGAAEGTTDGPAGHNSIVGSEREVRAHDSSIHPAGPVLDIYVFGRPAQQGSKSATMRGGRAVMFEDNKRTEPWRQAVVSAARQSLPAGWHRIPRGTAVAVSVAFTFDRPASAPKRRHYWQTTRTSGDTDKLIRSTFDAITAAGVWEDDSQVVRLREPFGKFTVGQDRDAMEIPGARIRIYLLEDPT